MVRVIAKFWLRLRAAVQLAGEPLADNLDDLVLMYEE
jgi:hypothetical protein